jgi:hypothetical protein
LVVVAAINWDDDLMADERPAAPVAGHKREEAMLDLVPLAGAGRQATHGDGCAEIVLWPPPVRRPRSASGVSPARNSASPHPIALRAMPVACMTAMARHARLTSRRKTPPHTLVKHQSERLKALAYGRFIIPT